jgi:hypothetical protein
MFMPNLPLFPDGLIISGNNQIDAEEAIGALRVFQLVPGIRAEVQIIPNDGTDGTQKDPFAGGELTIMMQDTRVVGYDNASALTLRATRNDTTGDGVAFTMRSLASGTAPQYPIEFDATNGTVQFKLTTDAKAWFYRQVQFEGHGDLPIVRLGPTSQPAIDFEDNTDANSCTYRIRSIGGSFSIYNTTTGQVPIEVNRDGRPIFRNAAAVNAAPNARIDPTTGELQRSSFSPPLLPAPLPTDGTASNSAMASFLNDLRLVMIAYGIGQ